VPVRINALSLYALGNALVSRISEHICLFAMHQCAGLRHVVDVGHCAHHCVRQTRIAINTDEGIHPEVPLIALLRLVRLGVALAAADLGRTVPAISLASTIVRLSSRPLLVSMTLTLSICCRPRLFLSGFLKQAKSGTAIKELSAPGAGKARASPGSGLPPISTCLLSEVH
jgi:hypothetical protein